MERWRGGRAAYTALALAGALTAGGAAHADGPMPRYHGMHPLSPHQGAFCYIDAPHVHRVPPPDMRVYLVLKNGENLFIGDPVALGYDGPRFGYFGPHPLTVPGLADAPPIFCYITGPHYHATPPQRSPEMVEKAGVSWYLGQLPPPADPSRVWINEVHAIAGYTPPKVDLTMAPPGYHPFTVMPPAPVVAAPPPSVKAEAAKHPRRPATGSTSRPATTAGRQASAPSHPAAGARP